MRRYFYNDPAANSKTAESGRGRRKRRSSQVVCWLREPSFLPTSRYLLVSATRAKDACISSTNRQKSKQSTTWKFICLNLRKTVFRYTATSSFSSRMAHQRITRKARWHCCPNSINDKDTWLSNSPDLNPLDYAVWGSMLEAYNKLSKNRRTLRNLMINCKTSGMIHDLSPLKNLFLGLGNACRLASTQMVDILNIHCTEQKLY